MTALAEIPRASLATDPAAALASAPAPDTLTRRLLGSGRVVVGGGVLLVMLLACLGSLPLTLWPGSPIYYDGADAAAVRLPPQPRHPSRWFGTDTQGRSQLGRSLLGGVLSLAIGVSAAAISIFLGVAVGLFAGYRGGWTDAVLMRSVDILYGLPYILLIILLKIALEPALPKIPWLGRHLFTSKSAAGLVVLFLAIGLVSWLTMARVVRGQVLSLRSQPFIEACRAGGLTERRIFFRHLLPNLIGPVAVYATLTIPQAILQESFLSFLGIGIVPPMPTWGSLASDALLPALNPVQGYWWLLLFPCTLLAVTLLSLNFLGDGLRDVFDPKRDAAKI